MSYHHGGDSRGVDSWAGYNAHGMGGGVDSRQDQGGKARGGAGGGKRRFKQFGEKGGKGKYDNKGDNPGKGSYSKGDHDASGRGEYDRIDHRPGGRGDDDHRGDYDYRGDRGSHRNDHGPDYGDGRSDGHRDQHGDFRADGGDSPWRGRGRGRFQGHKGRGDQNIDRGDRGDDGDGRGGHGHRGGFDDVWRSSVVCTDQTSGDNNSSSVPATASYSGAVVPYENGQDYHQAAQGTSFEGGSVLSTIQTPILNMPLRAQPVDAGPGNDLPRQAKAAIQDGDIATFTKILMGLTKNENIDTARRDPKWLGLLAKANRILHETSSTANPKDLADLAFVLGKLKLHDKVVVEIMQTIAEIARFRLESFTPHDISGMVWGFASLSVQNENLMSVTAAEVVNKIKAFDQRQLSNTAWAFAKCGLWNEQLVHAIANECLAKMSTFNAQSIAHISWAMAQWGTRNDQLMDAIAVETQRKISEFGPPSLGMTTWSFASLQVRNTQLMAVMGKHAQAKIHQFKTEELSHLAWAYANLRIQDLDLFNAMAQQVQLNITKMQPVELSHVAWAFAKSNLANQNLLESIAREAVVQILHFKPAEIAMLTWAFAVAGIQHPELMTAIGKQVVAALDFQEARQGAVKATDCYSAPQLSHIAWAFGALSLRHSDFFEALSKYVRVNMTAFKAQGLSHIAWAFAMVAFRDDSLLNIIAPEIAAGVNELRPLALARCCWAYRVLRVPVPSLTEAIAAESLLKVKDFGIKALAKLVDAIYLVPGLKESSILSDALSQKLMGDVVDLFVNIFGNRGNNCTENADEQEYTSGINQLGVTDFGIVGTPMLLQRLDIDMPSFEFFEKCRRQQAADQTEGTPRAEFAGAEVDLEWSWKSSPDTTTVCKWPCFLMHYDGCGDYNILIQTPFANSSANTSAEAGCADSPLVQTTLRDESGAVIKESFTPLSAAEVIPARENLIGVDLGGRFGKKEPAFKVLDEVHSRLRSLGGPDMKVTGLVQILSTQVPSVSTVGALWQFSVRYPGVKLEFLEQMTSLEDNYLLNFEMAASACRGGNQMS